LTQKHSDTSINLEASSKRRKKHVCFMTLLLFSDNESQIPSLGQDAQEVLWEVMRHEQCGTVTAPVALGLLGAALHARSGPQRHKLCPAVVAVPTVVPDGARRGSCQLRLLRGHASPCGGGKQRPGMPSAGSGVMRVPRTALHGQSAGRSSVLAFPPCHHTLRLCTSAACCGHSSGSVALARARTHWPAELRCSRGGRACGRNFSGAHGHRAGLTEESGGGDMRMREEAVFLLHGLPCFNMEIKVGITQGTTCPFDLAFAAQPCIGEGFSLFPPAAPPCNG